MLLCEGGVFSSAGGAVPPESRIIGILSSAAPTLTEAATGDGMCPPVTCHGSDGPS